MILLGGIMLNTIPVSLVMVSKKINEKYLINKSKKILDLKLLKSPVFLMLVIANGLHISSLIAVTIYLMRFAQSCGINNYLAASLSSIIGFIDVVLRPFAGVLTSMDTIRGVKVKRSYIFSIAALIQAIVVLCFTFVQEFYQFVIITICYAVSMPIGYNLIIHVCTYI